MNKLATTPVPPSEAGVLAAELGKSFGELVQQYEKYYSLTREEAVRRAAEPPADQVCWFDLNAIARTDPDRAAARWEEVKRAALEELRTGHRAAHAVEGINHQAWERAEFLALRAELVAEWHPRNGIERQLLDTMAQAQAGYLYWLQNLTMRTRLECHQRPAVQGGGAVGAAASERRGRPGPVGGDDGAVQPDLPADAAGAVRDAAARQARHRPERRAGERGPAPGELE